jgi:hypothetical protein
MADAYANYSISIDLDKGIRLGTQDFAQGLGIIRGGVHAFYTLPVSLQNNFFAFLPYLITE